MMLRLPILLVIAILLSACDNLANGGDESVTIIGPTSIPTPTLHPNLPTSTSVAVSTADVYGLETVEELSTLTPTPTVAPPPTATPIPAKAIAMATESFEYGDYQQSIQLYENVLQANEISLEHMVNASFGLGISKLEMGQYDEAINALVNFINLSTEDGNSIKSEESDSINQTNQDLQLDDAYYFLGRAYESSGDCSSAIEAYEIYLSSNQELTSYIYPRVADCYLALENRVEAITALELAVEGEADRLTEVNLRKKLADMYVETGEYVKAVNQYEAILNIALTENTRGEATYLAGTAELAAGNPEEGYAYYQDAVNNYPKAYESYVALSALVDAGFEVDEFQRGLVDFYAQAFDAAIAAFNRYLATNPEHREDIHLFLSWSYEQLGDYGTALNELEEYIRATDELLQATNSSEANSSSEQLSLDLARGWLEKAKLQARNSQTLDAIDSYTTYLELFPDGPDAPFAAWWTAALYENLGELSAAIDAYEALADAYPSHDDAAESLYRAGYLSLSLGEEDEAIRFWQTAAERYGDRRYGAAALSQLLKIMPEEDLGPFRDQASSTRFEDYYAIRVGDIASDTEPFEAAEKIQLTIDLSEQVSAESWLREITGLEEAVDIRTLSPELAEDGRLVRGQKLWGLGLYQEAKRELESLREEHSDDPIRSYQLALFFQELGLYRSSILAATSVMRNAGVDVFSAPKFIGKLAYPTYFSDLVLAETEHYGFDPLLMFALIRQESLFESIAQSHATAQGLSQVIPDTGAYIAQRLDWPDYENADLFKPYVGIAFGAYYIDQQLDSFDGDVAAALSAYNGGPGNAARWYAQSPGDIDAFVEIIDFSETRAYVQRIYAGQSIYKYLYGD